MAENCRRLTNPYPRNSTAICPGHFDDGGLKGQSWKRGHFVIQDWKAYYDLGVDSVRLGAARWWYGSIAEPLLYLTYRPIEPTDKRDWTLELSLPSYNLHR